MFDKKRILSFFLGRAEAPLVEKAYDLAQKVHENQKRDNGEPYFIHPYRVALILLDEFGMWDPNIVAAALLHDVLEDSYMSEEELEQQTNAEVARRVKILTKPKLRNEPGWEDKYYAGIRSADIGTQIIKFADRLDNIRDLKNTSPEKQVRYLKATKERFLPWMKEVYKGFHDKLRNEIRSLEEGMAVKECLHCKTWDSGRPDGIEWLAGINVLMSCGCGGEVKHSVLRCKYCGTYYLASYFDHKAFHGGDYEVSSLSREEAETLIRDIGKCSTPKDSDCRCEIHKSHEIIRMGKQVYSEKIPD